MRRYVPNLISSYRVFAAPVISLMIYRGHWVAGLMLCMVGFVTDLTDGYLARYWNVDSPPGGFGKWLDVFGDQTIIIAPVIGMMAAGELGVVGAVVVPLWIAAMYSTERLLPKQVDAVNGVIWTMSYILTGWQAFRHLPLDTALLFLGLTLMFMALGGLSHTELVGRGLRQAGLRR